MISPDSIPAWFAITFFIVASVAWFLIEVRHAVTDNTQGYSRLDQLDGLPHNG